MKPNRKLACIGLAILVLLAGTVTPAQAQLPEENDTSGLRKAGDIIHIALPAAAAASTLILKDWEGLIQFSIQFGLGGGTVAGLKESVDKTRPDTEDAR